MGRESDGKCDVPCAPDNSPNQSKPENRERESGADKVTRDVASGLPETDPPAGPAQIEQEQIVSALTQRDGWGGNEVTHIETHISHVFLVGDYAYKLKKAIQLSFLDYSTLEKRRACCISELEINRRTAPDLYLEVVPVTLKRGTGRDSPAFELNGSGRVVDWMVKMRRFDRANELDRVAAAGRLTKAHIFALADAISDLHMTARAVTTTGGAEGIQQTVSDLKKNLRAGIKNGLREAQVDSWCRAIDRHIEKQRRFMDQRRRHGFVRQCHGDLHLGNICLIDDRPVIFDAVEFNESFSFIDVLYDLAFILMDLIHRGFPDFAHYLLNRYLESTRDYRGLALIHGFVSMRAAIRAMIGGMKEAPQEARAQARPYLKLASDYLIERVRPRLIVVGGLSGTGKSTLAMGLGPRLGFPIDAVVLRTDGIRKRLAGVLPEQKLAPEFYAPDMNEKVYHCLRKDAKRALRAGMIVILDATFLRRRDREDIQEFARKAGVAFHGLWLHADPAVLRKRIAGRKSDVSDATVSVLERQLAELDSDQFSVGTFSAGWSGVEADGSPAQTLRNTISALFRNEL